MVIGLRCLFIEVVSHTPPNSQTSTAFPTEQSIKSSRHGGYVASAVITFVLILLLIILRALCMGTRIHTWNTFATPTRRVLNDSNPSSETEVKQKNGIDDLDITSTPRPASPASVDLSNQESDANMDDCVVKLAFDDDSVGDHVRTSTPIADLFTSSLSITFRSENGYAMTPITPICQVALTVIHTTDNDGDDTVDGTLNDGVSPDAAVQDYVDDENENTIQEPRVTLPSTGIELPPSTDHPPLGDTSSCGEFETPPDELEVEQPLEPKLLRSGKKY